jgi:molybdenum cofactor cytidylyltransferase
MSVINTAIVILAAGSSTRFGPANKLLATIGGEPVIRRTVRAAANSTAQDVCVVTGTDHDAILTAVDGLHVRLQFCPRHASGMGTSIAHGIAALSPDIGGAMILPGDMPAISSTALDDLLSVFTRAGGSKLVFAASPSGEQRNPVIWPARLFPRLRALDGAGGGKALFSEFSATAIGVPIADSTALSDIDTAEDLQRIIGALAKT